jgi:hypothetical protein
MVEVMPSSRQDTARNDGKSRILGPAHFYSPFQGHAPLYDYLIHELNDFEAAQIG